MTTLINELVNYLYNSVKSYVHYMAGKKKELEDYINSLVGRYKNDIIMIKKKRKLVENRCKKVKYETLKTGDNLIVVTRLVSFTSNLFFKVLQNCCQNAVVYHEAILRYRMKLIECIYLLEQRGDQLLKSREILNRS